jgi:hypothetical protein
LAFLRRGDLFFILFLLDFVVIRVIREARNPTSLSCTELSWTKLLAKQRHIFFDPVSGSAGVGFEMQNGEIETKYTYTCRRLHPVIKIAAPRSYRRE